MSASKLTLTLLILVGALVALASAQWPPVKSGPGDKRCYCFRTFTPVCGTDNKNYLSLCHLQCAKHFYEVDVKSNGLCPGGNDNIVLGDIDPSAFPWSG